VITVMPSNDAVKVIYLDDDGIVPRLKAEPPSKRKLLIECGTISLDTIHAVSNEVKSLNDSNIEFIDAPISGGPIGSKAGTLSFMVGCQPSSFSSLKSELLIHMGKESSLFHCGEVGSGTAFKTINNYVSIINILASSEAYAIATKLGLDLRKLTDVFNQSSGQNWVITNNNPVPGIHPKGAASNDYRGGFRLELAMKDLGLGGELAKLVGIESNLNRETLRVLREVQQKDEYAGRDARVVYRWLCEKEKKD
jgi:3-hydroxyisobutyrate/3-hydroxypropionate dehydrogenase